MIIRTGLRFINISAHRLYNVAIVGTGPAGFYTAHHLLHKSKEIPISIDFFDRLPTPFGLSRYGVAPDHPEVKNCEDYMDNLMANESFDTRFFGNVSVGRDISLSDLKNHYHSIVLAYGCTASDNKLTLPGSEHPAVIPARKLINWYNGHPDASDWSISLDKVEDVTIIGNGNVAIDVARILLTPALHWKLTDITTRAIDVLKKSAVKRVNIVARRGVLESAFSNKEIRELLTISEENRIKFLPVSESHLSPIRDKYKSLGRVDRRKFSILDKASLEAAENASTLKEWQLYYQMSPKQFLPDEKNPAHLQSTLFEENELVEDHITKTVSVRPKGNIITLKNHLIILSIGYQGSKLEGMNELDISYDEQKNCLSNSGGRLLKNSSKEENSYCRGWYTSGWIKRGPRGVIATTMLESFDTAEKILEDLTQEIYNHPVSGTDIVELLPEATVSWPQWKNIDRYEIGQGSILGKTREKLTSISALLRQAHSNV